MKIKDELNRLGLGIDNSVVIGSGVLDALGIRESSDIDLTVSKEKYKQLEQGFGLQEEQTHGRRVLKSDTAEIGDYWEVLGKKWRFEDQIKHSVVIDGVRYVTLEFLLRVKKSWASMDKPRQKDIDDVVLIEKYLATS